MSEIYSVSVLVVYDDGKRESLQLAGGTIDIVTLEKTDERPTATILVVAGDSEGDPLDAVFWTKVPVDKGPPEATDHLGAKWVKVNGKWESSEAKP